MFGNNPILKPENGDGLSLKVTSIFYTLQGEGPYTGHPSTFIRLAGCNLACSFCDTEFDIYNTLTVQQIITEVNKYYNNDISNELNIQKPQLVIITGGEPFRHPIENLCKELISCGYKVQIESNGTLYRNIPLQVEIVCSPKNLGSGYYLIREDVLKHTIAIKFLISTKNKLYHTIQEVGQSLYNIPVYIQPMDEYNAELNKANVKLAISLAQKHNAIFSLQLHKVIGID